MTGNARHLATAAFLMLAIAAGLFVHRHRRLQDEICQRPDVSSAAELQQRLDDETLRHEQLQGQLARAQTLLADAAPAVPRPDRRSVLDLMQRCGFVMVSDEPPVPASALVKARAVADMSDDLPSPRGGRIDRQTRIESTLLQRMDAAGQPLVVWRSTAVATFPGIRAFFGELHREHPNVLPLRWEVAADSKLSPRGPDGPGGPGLRVTLLLGWKVQE
ncbi:MAG TPA: hypothetical protein PLP01_07605 [Phycisphaerae bacterium]|nr:hypothetical protein [Phycisphaerae bacterium]